MENPWLRDMIKTLSDTVHVALINSVLLNQHWITRVYFLFAVTDKGHIEIGRFVAPKISTNTSPMHSKPHPSTDNRQPMLNATIIKEPAPISLKGITWKYWTPRKSLLNGCSHEIQKRQWRRKRQTCCSDYVEEEIKEIVEREGKKRKFEKEKKAEWKAIWRVHKNNSKKNIV